MEKIALTIRDPKKDNFIINPPGDIPTGGVKDGTLGNALSTTIDVLIIFAIIFCLFILVFSGYQWLSSSGDKQKLNQVKQRIVYALVGLIIVLMSFFAINILGGFFKIDFF